MCGRYLIDDEAYSDLLQILHNLNAVKNASGIDNLSRIDNLAKGEIFPTHTAPVIGNDGVAAVKWGFPHWKDTSVIINARSETALEKKMFSKSMKEQRCVVPSSGFFEWGNADGFSGETGSYGENLFGNSSYSGRVNYSNNKRRRKHKYLFNRPGEHTLYMAGIASNFRDLHGVEYTAFVILTTAANESVSPIHDRMPVILSSDEVDLWTSDNIFMEFAINRPGPELSAVIASSI